MLRIQGKQGKTKFVWKDEDEEPVSIDELILKADSEESSGKEKKDAKP